ncbi:MAG: sigma-70 family RNA polymerase sigma factor [Candidatus Eisenbacteria bacterium]|uniref:Sigma-70 family RNA polymerase sigma factor n=1 Tax=Eiseniibacteriota bacterium TaxID=2212470 RepID=A0A849SQS2_UNCEI|nr:sigma-70 family RNA polymerase sigma factor [Candidatus Eisenbacteria bacterium]
MRRFVSGDPEACREVERWSRAILFHRRLNLSREEIEDVVQDVIAQVWRAASSADFRLTHGLRAFVRTVTLARAIDRVRRQRVRRAEPLDETEVDPGPEPSRLAEVNDEHARLATGLRALDHRCREIIQLHYFEGWPYARIAARAQRRESTLRVRMFNCLRVLREHMGELGMPRP